MRRFSVVVLLEIVFAISALVLLIPATAKAQVDTGAITGTVKDPSGGVVVGATVTLANEGTGVELSTKTGSDGTYTFSPVPIGTYSITVNQAGFEKTTQTHAKVDVNAHLVLDFTVKPGSVTATVEVAAAPPVLQTQDASLGQVVGTREVNDMPLNGRNFTFLAQLVPGVTVPQADTRGNAANGAFSANGFRPAQNNYMLNGIDNNSDTVDFLNGTNFVVLPPVDAIQEFKVQTSDFSAQYGRSGAAVLNAELKSGTNQFHGDVWEYVRNDKFDAADFFERSGKSEFRRNDYGFTLGGPMLIPHVINGRNKFFFFGDYNGIRTRQGVPHNGTVPTLAERSSGYTDLSDLIPAQSGTETDPLGRVFANGIILDPATTRAVTSGQADPVTGLVAAKSGFVRDPFSYNGTTNAFGTGACPSTTMAFTSALISNCSLNHINPARLDPNAIKLLNLYPNPTNNAAVFSNFESSPKFIQNRYSWDIRADADISEKNQFFYSFSYVDDPQFIPGIFGGIADGGAFQEGDQTALAQLSTVNWTHVVSANTVNVVRAGFNYLHTSRVSPEASNLSNLPAQFGIQDIPQQSLNGGLPAFGISGLATLGSNAFLPSDEVSSTFQITDDFTKIYGKHTFKAGIEYQRVKFSTLQPPWSRGQFNFGGQYTQVPEAGAPATTGIADFLLTPIASTVPGGVNFVGGPGASGSGTAVYVSNISLTDDGKNYYGSYLEDDWKVSPKLTLNIGLRWDYFGQVFEHHNNQANFVPGGAPVDYPLYVMPPGVNSGKLSPSFTSLLAKDGIGLAITNAYGGGLGNSQHTNFAPRVGLAYQVANKLVARAAFGLFYNGFENRGFSPNIGENYPFQFNFSFAPANDETPIAYAGCTSPYANNGAATLETGFSCTPLDPLLVNASGLALRGIQFNYQTPYSMQGNLTLQYQFTPTTSVQASYVSTQGRHLEVFPSSNQVSQILPNKDVNGKGVNRQNYVPWPDFGYGNSYAATIGNSQYNALQLRFEKQYSNGLYFLFGYTYAKAYTDAGDLLNGGSVAGYRAPDVPGFGIQHDYGLADFDVRNAFVFSGDYELPFGKGKHYLNEGGPVNTVLGGWTLAGYANIESGQPVVIGCPTGTTSGTNCDSFLVPGINPVTPIHFDPKTGNPIMLNPAAFTQPCQLQATTADPTGAAAPIPNSPTGCIPVTGFAALGPNQPASFEGPPFRRLDLSAFKNFQLSERFQLAFRADIFNVFNHPFFNAPGFGGNGVVAISGSTNFTQSTFGEIGSTRDAPNDPREIQFSLTLRF